MNNGLGNLRIRLQIYLKRSRIETTTKKKLGGPKEKCGHLHNVSPTRSRQMERKNFVEIMLNTSEQPLP